MLSCPGAGDDRRLRASATIVITEHPAVDGVPLSTEQVRREVPVSAGEVTAGGPLSGTGRSRPHPRMPMGFGPALIVLVALGGVTLASINDLVSANAAVTRSLEALERLQALKAVVRQLEATELLIQLTGREQYSNVYDAAEGDIVRLHGDLDRLVDAPQQRERLQQLSIVISDLSAAFRSALASRAAGGTARPAGE